MLSRWTLCASAALSLAWAEPPAAPAGSTATQPATTAERRGTAAIPGEEDEHVVSQSRMFSVSGGDALRMGAIATKADEVRGAVCRLLGVDTTWKYGISIRLIGRSTDPAEPNPIRTRIRIIGNEPNFQIRIFPGGGIDVDRLTNAIITMTLFERALAPERIEALPESVNIPQWLITGIQQAVLWRSGKADRRLYRSLFERAHVLTPEEIVSAENVHRLDATSRQVYEVSCGVLIMCLVNQAGGPAQLRELISESALADGSPREIITAHFHELGINANMLNRWWALELASLSIAPATERLTPMETEEQLAEALNILLYDPETLIPRTISADDAYALTALPDWRMKIRPCVDRLMQLNLRAFPGYSAIIEEYCHAFNELMQGKGPDEVQNLLGPLRELRKAYITTSLRGRDYLDWYEITHLGQGRHREGFQAYLETMKLLREEKPGPDTPISQYLQDIEDLYNLPSGGAFPESLRRRVQEASRAAREARRLEAENRTPQPTQQP